jgi:hypothetical protein
MCVAAVALTPAQRAPLAIALAGINAVFNWYSLTIMEPFFLEPRLAPNSWSLVNFVTSVAGLGFLLFAAYLRFWS